MKSNIIESLENRALFAAVSINLTHDAKPVDFVQVMQNNGQTYAVGTQAAGEFDTFMGVWQLNGTGGTLIFGTTTSEVVSPMLRPFGSKLLLMGYGGGDVSSCYVIDGTSGTKLNGIVADKLYLGTDAGRAYFGVDGKFKLQVVSSDQTDIDVIDVEDSFISDNPSINHMAFVGGIGYLDLHKISTVQNQSELYQTDGTQDGTAEVLQDGQPVIPFSSDQAFISDMTSFNGKLAIVIDDLGGYYSNFPSQTTLQLLDPADNSFTSIVLPVDRAFFDSGCKFLGVVNGKMVISSNESILATDGTDGGTSIIHQGGIASSLINQGSYIYFNTGEQIWKTDGTSKNTKQIKGIGNAAGATILNSKLYLSDANKPKLFRVDSDQAIEVAKWSDTTEPLGSLTTMGDAILFTKQRSNNTGELIRFTPSPTTTAVHSITGRVFNDKNHNGKQDAGESGVNSIRVFIDANRNGGFDLGEKVTYTDINGNYHFDNLAKATYNIRVTVPTPWKPVGSKTAKLTFSGTLISQSFGVYK